MKSQILLKLNHFKRKEKNENTWKKSYKYTEEMKNRGEEMIEMLSCYCEWNSIVDIGCGNQQLRSFIKKIKPKAKYIGIDRLDHCEDTLLADFNKGEYPKVKADVAIVSGVFEYIYPKKIKKFLDNICTTSDTIAFSYWPADTKFVLVESLKKERPKSWTNHFKLGEIIEFFNSRDFHIELLKKYKKSSQYMMIFKANK